MYVFACRGYSGECHILTHSMIRNFEINNTARKLRIKFPCKSILLTSELFVQFDIFDILFKMRNSFAIYRSPNAVLRLKYCGEQIYGVKAHKQWKFKSPDRYELNRK